MRILRITLALAIAIGAAAQTLPNAAPFAYNATPQFFDLQGRPLAGGKVCTYAAGTTTPQATYTDAGAGTANDNPIVLNSAGMPQKSGSVVGIFGGTALYKVVVRTAGSDGTCATGSVLTTYDQIGDIGLYFANTVKNAGTCTLITYTNPQTGGTSETCTAKLAQTVSPLDFNAKCDGVTDDTTAITNAIAAAAASSLDLVINGTAACITGAQTISTTIHMRGPGTLKRKTGVSAALLTVTANQAVIDGVTLDGNSQGGSGGNVVYINGPTGFSLINSTVANNVAGETAVQCNACTNALFQGNTLVTGIVGPGINIINGSTRVKVIGNVVNHASSSNGTLVGAALGAHTSSGTLSDITFSGNTVYSAVGWGIEAGSQGGGTVSQITMTGNTVTINNSTGSVACTAGAGAIKPCGGYSLSVVQDSSINGNTFNAAGQTLDIASLQAVQCTRCVISSNTLVGTTDSTLNGSSGMLLECNACTVTSNLVNHWGAVAAVHGIDFRTITGFEQVDGNTISGNHVIFPTTSALMAAISIQCSVASGAHSTSYNVVTGNTLDGTATAATENGIFIQQTNPSCAVTGNVMNSNVMVGMTDGIYLATALQSTVVGNNFAPSVTVPYTCSACTYNTLLGQGASDANTASLFANLATCTSVIAGAVATIYDSNTNVWGATAAGGGANNVQVRCNATVWTVVGK